MKKIILSVLLLPIAAQSQTIQGTDYPQAGTVNTLFMADTTGVNPGSAGDGMTWDFSTLVNSGQVQTDTFLIPSATPYAASFPTATIVDHQQYPGTNYYIYYKDDGSELQRVGNVQPDTVPYLDPANEFAYPISYGSSNVDAYYASYTSNGFLTHMHGNMTSTVDGRGTLKLPTGTYANVIRVKFTRDELDTAFSTPTIPGTLSQTIYYWYQTSLYYPLLTIMTTNVTFNGFPPIKSKKVGYRQGTTGAAGIEEYTDDASSAITTYPNPANENIEINYQLNQSQKVNFTLFNLNGEIVKYTEDETQNIGNHSLKINLTEIPNGMYILKSNFGSMEKIIVHH